MFIARSKAPNTLIRTRPSESAPRFEMLSIKLIAIRPDYALQLLHDSPELTRQAPIESGVTDHVLIQEEVVAVLVERR
jgi:hypothetical protein